MPQPKGYEPFCRVWTVYYSVLCTPRIFGPGELVSRPRARLLLNADDANFFYSALRSEATYPLIAGHIAPGTIQTPILTKFYNKKSFIQTFTQNAYDQLSTSN